MWPAHHPLEIILAKNRPWLLRLAQRLGGSRGDAEDLVHDVFVRFMNTFETGPVPDERGCVAWFATTLRHCFLSHLRKAEVQGRVKLDPSFRESVVSLLEPRLPAFYETVADEELEGALRTLSPKQRETLEAIVAGRRYDEIAQVLGISRGTVAKRLHDARQRLRKALLARRPREEK